MISIDRLKFKDALEIDQQVGAEGVFVGICAEVCSLYLAMDTLAPRESQPDAGSRNPSMGTNANAYRRVAILTTKLYRWLQFLHGEEDAWLQDFRAQLR